MEHSKDTPMVEAERDIPGIPQIEVGDKSEHPIAPDQFDEKYRTSRMEIWAYYACVCR